MVKNCRVVFAVLLIAISLLFYSVMGKEFSQDMLSHYKLLVIVSLIVAVNSMAFSAVIAKGSMPFTVYIFVTGLLMALIPIYLADIAKLSSDQILYFVYIAMIFILLSSAMLVWRNYRAVRGKGCPVNQSFK